ncbi:MAG: tetratricopeptide repeat protein [Methylovulum sp.]
MGKIPVNVMRAASGKQHMLRFCIGFALVLMLGGMNGTTLAASRYYSSSVEIALLKQRIEQFQQQQSTSEEQIRQATQDLQQQKSLTEIIQKQLENNLKENDRRIEDLHEAMNRSGIILSISIGLFGALIIGIIVVFSMRTEKSARMAAENEIKSWINERENFRAKELMDDKIKSTFERFNQEAEKTINTIASREAMATETSKSYERSLQELTLDNVSQRLKQSPELKKALHDKVKLVLIKSDEHRSFADWHCLLLDAWDNKEFNQALRCANQARKAAVTDIDIAKSVSSQSACLQATGHTEEAIACFDEVIDRYGDRSDGDFSVLLAKTMYSKGLTLRQRYTEAAIAQYDQLINRFSNNSEADIVEVVAGAMLRKAATLEQLNEFNFAMSQYEEIVIRYGERRESNIAAEVEKARHAIERLTFGNYLQFDHFKCGESS